MAGRPHFQIGGGVGSVEGLQKHILGGGRVARTKIIKLGGGGLAKSKKKSWQNCQC